VNQEYQVVRVLLRSDQDAIPAVASSVRPLQSPSRPFLGSNNAIETTRIKFVYTRLFSDRYYFGIRTIFDLLLNGEYY
jgi:hypothetical protein